MKVLIDPSSHHLLNVGDVAMLQVCVSRLQERWPTAQIAVVTEAPQLLGSLCPQTLPIPAAGRYGWLRQPEATGDATRPERLARRLPRAAAHTTLSLEARRRGRRQPELRAFADAMLAADLFLMSGRGGLTDAFGDESIATLEELRFATTAGVPVALMGQGIGPLDDELARRAGEVLPALDLICLREGRAAPALLAGLGVAGERVIVTGDDAIELALGATGSRAALAVSVRVADYAALSADQLDAVARGVRTAAARAGAALEPLAMSRHPHEQDAATLERLCGTPAVAPKDPSAAIGRIGGARVMVAGSYHAAVLALAQGIPAVCLAGSPYYDWKFAGLWGQFGDGCALVSVTEPDVEQRIADAVEQLWHDAPALEAPLRAAALGQVEASRGAYDRLEALLARPQRRVQRRGGRSMPRDPVSGAQSSR